MQTRYIPAFVMLIAGAITGIISILKKFEFLYTLEILLIVLILFYIVGILAKKIIEKTLKAIVKDDIESDTEDETVTEENEFEE